MKNYLIILLLVALVALHAWGMMREDRLQEQIKSLKAQQMAVQAQQAAITARQVGICAVQGWQTGMMVQYLEMGRGR